MTYKEIIERMKNYADNLPIGKRKEFWKYMQEIYIMGVDIGTESQLLSTISGQSKLEEISTVSKIFELLARNEEPKESSKLLKSVKTSCLDKEGLK